MRLLSCLAVFVHLSIPSLLKTEQPHQHQSYDTSRFTIGWQEPGLWRPKWIMDRYFYGNDGKVERRNRVIFKLYRDRSMKIFDSADRPLLEIWNSRRKAPRAAKLSSKVEENVPDATDMLQDIKREVTERKKEIKRKDSIDRPAKIEGSWWWQDLAPIKNKGKIKIETVEGADEIRYRHEGSLDFGKLDPYAAKFRKGRISKYRNPVSGVPLGLVDAGYFTICVSPHRPLVAKEFTAFQ